MAKTRGTLLLMVWADIDAELEPEFTADTIRSICRGCCKSPVF